MAETTVTTEWQGGYRFTAKDIHGHSVVMDAPQRDGDPFEGFTPSDLLLGTLAGCSGVDVVNILQRQRQHVTGLQIIVRGQQNPEPPWPYETIQVEYLIKGHNLRDKAVARAVKLSQDKYCAVGATLAGTVTIESKYKIQDAD